MVNELDLYLGYITISLNKNLFPPDLSSWATYVFAFEASDDVKVFSFEVSVYFLLAPVVELVFDVFVVPLELVFEVLIFEVPVTVEVFVVDVVLDVGVPVEVVVVPEFDVEAGVPVVVASKGGGV